MAIAQADSLDETETMEVIGSPEAPDSYETFDAQDDSDNIVLGEKHEQPYGNLLADSSHIDITDEHDSDANSNSLENVLLDAQAESLRYTGYTYDLSRGVTKSVNREVSPGDMVVGRFTLSTPSFVLTQIKYQRLSNAEIWIENENLDTVYVWNADGYTENSCVLALDAGSYRMYTRNYAKTMTVISMAYDAVVNVEGNVEHERNAWPERATKMNIGTIMWGTLGTGSRKNGTDIDYYYFDITSKSFVSLYIMGEFPSLDASYDLGLGRMTSQGQSVSSWLKHWGSSDGLQPVVSQSTLNLGILDPGRYCLCLDFSSRRLINSDTANQYLYGMRLDTKKYGGNISTATASLEGSPYTFTGQQIKPTVSVTYAGQKLSEGTDYRLEYGENINPGTGTVSIKGIGSFSGTKELTFTINPKTIVVTARNATKRRGEGDPVLQATVEGADNPDAIKYTLSREKGEAVGTYVITPAGESSQCGYNVTYKTGTFSITANPNDGQVFELIASERCETNMPLRSGESTKATLEVADDCLIFLSIGTTGSGGGIAKFVRDEDGVTLNEWRFSGVSSEEGLIPLHKGTYTLTLTSTDNSTIVQDLEYRKVKPSGSYDAIETEVNDAIGTANPLLVSTSGVTRLASLCKGNGGIDVDCYVFQVSKRSKLMVRMMTGNTSDVFGFSIKNSSGNVIKHSDTGNDAIWGTRALGGTIVSFSNATTIDCGNLEKGTYLIEVKGRDTDDLFKLAQNQYIFTASLEKPSVVIDQTCALLCEDGTISACSNVGEPADGSTKPKTNTVSTLFIANDVESIPQSFAYRKFDKLQVVKFCTNDAGKNACKSIEGWAFSGCNALQRIDGLSATSITSIGMDAFEGCKSLKELVLPPTVKEIGSWVFEGCTSLKTLVIPSPTVAETMTFTYDGSLFDVKSNNGAWIYVPKKLVNKYKKSIYEFDTSTHYWPQHIKSKTGFFIDADPLDSTNHGGEVDWMGRSNISTGWTVSKGREYRGLKDVTRCDFAAFLYRLGDLSDNGKRDDSIAIPANRVSEVLATVSDCDAKTSHASEVAWLIDSGISRGWADEGGETVSFRPMAKVARQDMAAFLYRFADIQDDGEQNQSLGKGSIKASFTDVQSGDETNHASEVEWLASVGVTTGWSVKGGKFEFRGKRTVKRQDMAAFMYRLNGYLGR